MCIPSESDDCHTNASSANSSFPIQLKTTVCFFTAWWFESKNQIWIKNQIKRATDIFYILPWQTQMQGIAVRFKDKGAAETWEKQSFLGLRTVCSVWYASVCLGLLSHGDRVTDNEAYHT